MPNKHTEKSGVAVVSETETDLSQTDPAELEELAAIGCTAAEAAGKYNVSERAFREHLKRPEARAAWRRGKAMGRIGLRRAQFKLAEKNAVIAVMLGKRMLGQKDPVDAAGGNAVTVIVDTGIDRGDNAED